MTRRRVALWGLAVFLCGSCRQTLGADGPRTTTGGTVAVHAPSTGAATMAIDEGDLQAIAHRYREGCGSPGAAVGVREAGGEVVVVVSGELAPGVAISAESQFLAGSVTKLFVASVALQLIADGQLGVDDTVDHYLPDWPRADQITIAMLLGHRSGMGDYGNDFSDELRDLVLSDLNRVFTYDEVLDIVRVIPPVTEPGAAYHYSNANTIVLGAILQQLTDRSLGRLIDERVIEPLALTRTFYGPDELDAAAAVEYHGLYDVLGTGEPVDIGGVPRAAALTVDPAGAGLFASIPDLLTATHGLFAGDVVLDAPGRALLADEVSTLTAQDLLLDDRFAIHGHGGVSPGAQTIVARDDAHAVSVAVWCNRLDPGEYELLPSVVAARDTLELAARSG